MKWNEVTVDSIKAHIPYALVGGPFGSNLTQRDYVEEGVPIIRGGNLPTDKLFSEEDFVFVREQKADELFSNNAYRGDIIFTQRGTLGQVGLIPETAAYDRYVISQSQMKLTVDRSLADARFVYYYFRHPQTVQAIKNRAITSGVPHINLGILKEFRLPLPPIDKQQEIVKILIAYDDFIDNNRRRIALLEESARLLYREWFVHLRFPGHEHVKGEGGIPEGWEKKQLGIIAKLNYGKALKEDNRIPGPYPVYGSSGVVGWHEKPLVPGPGIVVGRKGNVGSVYWSISDFYPIDTVYFIESESSNYYLYFALQYTKFINTDVAVPGLNRDLAHSQKIFVPDKQTASLFEEYTTTTYKQIHTLQRHNDNLAQARDLLLPRLMNGELAV